MQISDQIALIAAILVGGGTLTLAIMTWKSIRQTRSIQKAEKRERLLKEIVEWAIDVAKYSLQTGVFDETIPISGLAAEGALPELLDSVVNFRMARAKSVYILCITSRLNPRLKGSVDTLTEEIKKQIKLLMEYKRKTTPTWPANEVVAKIAGNNERMYNLATGLIEEATKLKAGDIS